MPTRRADAVTDRAAGPRPDDRWGATAGVYRWQEPLQRTSVAAVLRVLAPLPAEVVLDLGAGTGLVERALTAVGVHRVVALEPSPGMLRAADLAGRPAVRGDAVRVPVATGSVDVVTASWLLHVLSPTDRAAAVAEAARVLRPGGRLGLVVPAVPRTRAQHLLRAAARGLADRRGLGAFHVPVDLPGLLTDAGLQVRHHARTGRGYLADVVVCTRATTGPTTGGNHAAGETAGRPTGDQTNDPTNDAEGDAAGDAAAPVGAGT